MSSLIPNSKIQNGGALTGEEVVISGISGLFPKSNNVSEFMDNLYNKVDMITEENLLFDHADVPRHTGRISGIEKFDAQFFRVTHNQTKTLEPMCRKLMEQAYCAMYDAGVNPLLYKGKKIGVFAGTYHSESASFLTKTTKGNAFMISGGSKTMLANRISYWLDAKGPSYSVVNTCGSLVCLDRAFNCIKNGECEAAIVTGSEFTLDKISSVNLRNAGLVSLDGKTKCFDKNADGCVKSQAVGVIFLQKAKDAKRIYAEVRNCLVTYGLHENNLQQKPEHDVIFLSKFYNKSGVDPNEVDYVEAHGAATPAADANELRIIGEVFGKKKQVMVGCVKSNMGDSDSANGICALIKLCLAYNTGNLAGNLHYNDPLDVSAIKECKVKVLTDRTLFDRGYTAINDFSYTGTDCHVILKGHYRPKDLNRYKSTIPRLICVSGRQAIGVQKIFDKLKRQPLDPELIGMLQDIYQVETPGFTCRGYTILDSKDEDTVNLAESTELYQGAPPPLWLLFSGMGSQWAGMGTELMRIPIFAAAIEKCRKVLEPKGVDIVKILSAPEKTIFDKILNSFVGIAAVQIGLTDVLKKMGLVPDYIIGHSVGEIGCAYFDDCFSAEEMILAAYTRGLVSIQTQLIKGSMAAVGLGYNKILPICPPEIDIACHNSTEFCTISGPKDAIDIFVSELISKGIFAKLVPTGNIAFHSRYIKELGPEFLKQLKEIIKTPIKRSSKWITTSWPEKINEKDALKAELCSAEYHTNNLISPVYFEEAARKIPYNAVIVEVAPHGLMQAIVRKSHPSCIHIPLTRRGHGNPLKFLLEAFGKLYQQGFNLNVGVLYPKIEYPVSTETSLLSDFVQWYHEEDWIVYTYNMQKRNDNIAFASRTIPVSVQDDDFKFLAGHLREGNIVFPEAAVLFYIWNTFAMFKGVAHDKLPVVFRDVKFYTDVVIDVEETVNLKFEIFKGNQYFEVTRDNIPIANGFIEISISDDTEMTSEEPEYTCGPKHEKGNIQLRSSDIYKIFKLKGYCYQNEFKSIQSSSSLWKSSLVKHTENWIILLDSLIQFNILANNYDGVSVPKFIRELTINTTDHLKNISKIIDGKKFLTAHFCKTSGVTKCGGVKVCNIIFNDKSIEESQPDVLKDLTYNSNELGERDVVHQKDILSCSFYSSFSDVVEYKLKNFKTGDIGSLKWTEVENNNNNINRVKVCFAAPSMIDAQNAVGLVTAKRNFGMDFSGIDSKGNKVMGLVDGGALSSIVEPDHDLLWPVPKHWTLQEAATVPLPYVHAFYCLIIRGELKQGHVVFVSGGSGALGQAVISICLSLGCNVYTTVGDAQKKRFLMRLFPNLDARNISQTRDIEFYNMVVCASENKRCDIVINCATGLLRELAMKCVGNPGHFFDVSDYDRVQNNNFGMQYLHLCTNYVNVNLSNLFKPENIEEKKLLRKVVSEGIANGMIKPISYVEYSADEVEKAFRLLSQRRHRGRAVIKISDVENINITPGLIYPTDGIFMIVNEDYESNLALKLTTHLVKSGAMKIIYHQKYKIMSGILKAQLAVWKNLGATVTVLSNNFEIETNCQEIFKKVGIPSKIHGIFFINPDHKRNKDDVIEIKNFPSVVGNLSEISKNNCPNLKYFVIFACDSEKNVDDLTQLEKICDTRAKIGLPALLIRTKLLEDYQPDEKSIFRMMSAETAIKSMEISLNQICTKILAYNKKRNTSEFLEKIAKIMGTNNLEEIGNLQVDDIVSNEVTFVEIQLAVKEYYKLTLPITHIKEMAISRLTNLTKPRNEQNTRFNSKLGAFFNFIDSDEINATEIFVPMLTQISLAEGQQNLHAKATNLMMLPGFEGHHYVFESISKSLKIRATTLQFGPDSKNESIQQMALDLKERIKTRFVLEPKFYLLGYSFGINIALEIAALLEKDGFVGVVYCLDSSPDALREQLNAYLGPMTEAQLQNAIIKHLFHVISGQTCKKLEDDIEKMNDWAEKVTECIENLKEFGTSNEYKRNIIDGFYKRICLARSYNPKMKLESNIVLLKGIIHPEMGRLAGDYGLSKYAKNPLKILQITSDVALAPNDSRVPNVVNQFLDPELLQEFKRKNLCDTYVMS